MYSPANAYNEPPQVIDPYQYPEKALVEDANTIKVSSVQQREPNFRDQDVYDPGQFVQEPTMSYIEEESTVVQGNDGFSKPQYLYEPEQQRQKYFQKKDPVRDW